MNAPNLTTRPSPWAGAVIVKLSVTRTGSPVAFFDVRFPLLEATIVGCTLRRTKLGRLWCSPPKLRRQLPDGATQYDDVIEWDGGGPASRFSAACIEAIQRHSPPALPQPRRDEPVSAPGWWERDR